MRAPDTIYAGAFLPQSSTAGTPEARTWSYRHLAICFFLLNAISALFFIGLIRHPIYDDLYNMMDVHRYASEGVTVGTLRRQVNAPGPTSFLWMAAGVRLLGGDELRAARLAALSSWLLLGVGVLIGARYSRFPQLWYFALITTLVFPHTATASASVLTEGPALLFGMLGAFLWTESLSQSILGPRPMFLAALGALLMGVAITCRQYYLMLLPAAALFALMESRVKSAERSSRRLLVAAGSLSVAIVPIVLMALPWKGLSSPAIPAGVSGVGINVLRPLVTAFYVALYLLPLTFPAMLRLRPTQRVWALPLAVLAGIGAAVFRSLLLQPGPLQSLIHSGARVPGAGFIVFGLIAAATTYNAVALGIFLWEHWTSMAACPPVVFALLAIVFFIGEQAGIGGNIPFFDRYVMELAPFFGLVALYALPRLTSPRLLALLFLAAVGQVMLWRHAFGG